MLTIADLSIGVINDWEYHECCSHTEWRSSISDVSLYNKAVYTTTHTTSDSDLTRGGFVTLKVNAISVTEEEYLMIVLARSNRWPYNH